MRRHRSPCRKRTEGSERVPLRADPSAARWAMELAVDGGGDLDRFSSTRSRVGIEARILGRPGRPRHECRRVQGGATDVDDGRPTGVGKRAVRLRLCQPAGLLHQLLRWVDRVREADGCGPLDFGPISGGDRKDPPDAVPQRVRATPGGGTPGGVSGHVLFERRRRCGDCQPSARSSLSSRSRPPICRRSTTTGPLRRHPERRPPFDGDRVRDRPVCRHGGHACRGDPREGACDDEGHTSVNTPAAPSWHSP